MTGDRYKIAIVGLGLMGGSLAYALRGFKGAFIAGSDLNSEVCESALSRGAVDFAGDTREAIRDADMVILCVYPHHVASVLSDSYSSFKPGAIITDICGVKTHLYNGIKDNLPENVDYVGVHPMAGREVDGFDNADGNLFRGTGFIITPLPFTKPETLDEIRELAQYIGAARIVETPYAEHDDIIAYTSDLMHISAASLCMNFHPGMTLAHTAGAFRDCTRIANINAELWTELLLENRDHTIMHLDAYISNLQKVRAALEKSDDVTLFKLLDTACRNKKEMLTR